MGVYELDSQVLEHGYEGKDQHNSCGWGDVECGSHIVFDAGHGGVGGDVEDYNAVYDYVCECAEIVYVDYYGDDGFDVLKVSLVL